MLCIYYWIIINSNTTLVKVKLAGSLYTHKEMTIQIQHLLKLNSSMQSSVTSQIFIQIQHLLKLNMVDDVIKVIEAYSNTTLVKVKLENAKSNNGLIEFKYNTC